MRTSLWTSLLAAGALVSCSAGESQPPRTAAKRSAVVGNIHPKAIQIDGPASGADLFSALGAPLNAGAAFDWVATATGNAGTGCLGGDAVATCVEPGVTGAVGGAGTWTGARIVDGIAGADQNIFVKGGKENDTSTWLVAPGTVGSSKFDLVQAYLANNQTTLFFGMERAGTNGTTAFDFEFNQLAPMALASCPQDPIVPCRSVGDVLFTFEMQGSGSSGSAVAYIFRWDGARYAAEAPAGIYSSINTVATPGGPWGHVNAHGDWVLGDLDRFQFAEAMAPTSLLPGVNSCGGRAWVQVRTRSSASETSDLKDTTHVFPFIFNHVEAEATLTPSCDQGFAFAATATSADGQPLPGAACAWTFSDGTTAEDCAGFHAAAPGTYTATVVMTDSTLPGCDATDDADAVDVWAPVEVTADLTATCVLRFGYAATASGGSGAENQTFAWTFAGGPVTPSTSSQARGEAAVAAGGVTYGGTVVVTDARDGLACTATASDTAVPYAPLTLDLALRAPAPACPMASDAVTYEAQASGGDGEYAITWYGPACAGTSCTIDPDDSAFCADGTVSAQLSDTSGLCPPVASEVETYAKVTTVTASDAP